MPDEAFPVETQASTAKPASFHPREDRRIYMVWIGLVWALIAAGFLSDFSRYFAEDPPPPMILHVHGMLITLWLALVTAQILLVERGNVRLHRTLGWWGHYFWGTALIVPAMMGWDLWRHKRIHPALLSGAALLAVVEATAAILFFWPAWSDAMVRLVEWWGYAG